MKILIVTIPLRDSPAIMAPIGALSIINYVRKHSGPDVQIELFNIDVHRPAYEDTLRKICEFKPDILGISAVVSTAYAYTKRLSFDVNRLLPDALIVVGGNLSASAEVLLRRANVDLCVIGEGEKIFLNVVTRARETTNPARFGDIKGLCFLDADGALVNTGYEELLPGDEVWDVNWDDLDRDGSQNWHFPACSPDMIKQSRMGLKKENFDLTALHGKTVGILTCAKGCVSRCTFCHRWDKGIRHIPVDVVMARLDVMIKRYNVGMIDIIAEAFGQDKRWLDEFLERIKPYHMPWCAGGVRTSMVDPDLLRRMQEAGCYAIYYGNETGSRKMLEVMEKKVDLEDNYNAEKWAIEAGLDNIIQLVIGMPGESPETIRETIEYVKFGTTLSPEQDPRRLSINYAQALPGTPLYEFARRQGLIGSDIDSEEQYLLAVSDRNAADPLTCINFTNYSRLTYLSWAMLIRIEVRYHYMEKFGAEHYYRKLVEDRHKIGQMPDMVIKELNLGRGPSGRLFLKLLLRGRFSVLMTCFPAFFYRHRRMVGFLMLISIIRESGMRVAWSVFKDYIYHAIGVAKRPWQFQYRSLRKIVDREIPPLVGDSSEMIPLRKGR